MPKRRGPPPADLPRDEAARRERQRERRELALKLRAEGKTYTPRKRPHKPRRAVQCIVIPIYWARKPGERDAVLEAAEAAQAVVRAAGVRCGVDSSTRLTPGQKMRAWEEKGVKWRVEIGAREAAAGTAVLATVTEKGAVARREALVVGPPLAAALRTALGLAGDEPGNAGDAVAAPPAQARGGAEAEQPPQQQPPAGAAGGDDLEGDFAGLEDSGGGVAKGKAKGKAKKADDEPPAPPLGWADDAAAAAKKRKKKAKVVKF